MGDELSKDSPAPVLPLGYFEPGRDPWRPVLRGATWFTLLLNGYHLISYLVPLACYAWEQATFAKSMPHRIEGMPRVTGLPFAFAALIIFIGSVDMLKLIESGRRWVVGGSLVMMAIVPVRYTFEAFYYHFTRHHWRYGQPYEVMMFAEYLLPAVGGCIVPFFTWQFFRRGEVREIFNQRRFRVTQAT